MRDTTPFPDWDLDFSYGKEGEERAEAIIQGMISGTTEVKRDRKFHNTGNIYVEYECLRADGWSQSGIRTSQADNWTFILGNSNIAISVQTEDLKLLFDYYYGILPRVCPNGSHPTKGVAIPVEAIIHYAETGQIGLNEKYNQRQQP